MVNRLVEPTSGRVAIDGEDTSALEAHALRRRIGYGFQQVGLFPHLSVAENIGVTPTLLGWPDPKTAARVDALLELVELPPAAYRDRMPAELSGGQQQRVGLARALAAEPGAAAPRRAVRRARPADPATGCRSASRRSAASSASR